jgi:translation initiation factor 2B subunit (eIF-2B alpha/beta/delta family)
MPVSPDALIRALARDRRSGAAELALRACRQIRQWISRSRPKPAELTDLALRLHAAQPGMAPLLRLANALLMQVEQNLPVDRQLRELASFERELRTGPRRAAMRCARLLRRKGHLRVATYSFSSTVLTTLLLLRSRLECVLCSEGRPLDEGRRLAAALASRGVAVEFYPDLALVQAISHAHVFLIGADAICGTGFVNRAGTGLLVRMAGLDGVRVLIVADASKFLPQTLEPYLRFPAETESRRLWPRAPRGVRLMHSIFEWIPWDPELRIVSDRRTLSFAQLPSILQRIRVAEALLRGLTKGGRNRYVAPPHTARP